MQPSKAGLWMMCERLLQMPKNKIVMQITYSCLNLISDCELVIKLPAVAGLICTPHAVIPATARAKEPGRSMKTTLKKFENN